jgi:hypothetical protein
LELTHELLLGKEKAAILQALGYKEQRNVQKWKGKEKGEGVASSVV